MWLRLGPIGAAGVRLRADDCLQCERAGAAQLARYVVRANCSARTWPGTGPSGTIAQMAPPRLARDDDVRTSLTRGDKYARSGNQLLEILLRSELRCRAPIIADPAAASCGASGCSARATLSWHEQIELKCYSASPASAWVAPRPARDQLVRGQRWLIV